jgi:hypothetical protein
MRRRAQYGLVGHCVKKLRNCSSVVVGIRGIRSVRSRLCVGRPGESGGKALDRPVVSYSYERQVAAMYITSRHKEGRGNASNVQLAEQDSLYTLDDSDDETQSRLVEQQLEVLDRGSASSRNISVANMGGIQSIGESI